MLLTLTRNYWKEYIHVPSSSSTTGERSTAEEVMKESFERNVPAWLREMEIDATRFKDMHGSFLSCARVVFVEDNGNYDY